MIGVLLSCKRTRVEVRVLDYELDLTQSDIASTIHIHALSNHVESIIAHIWFMDRSIAIHHIIYTFFH